MEGPPWCGGYTDRGAAIGAGVGAAAGAEESALLFPVQQVHRVMKTMLDAKLAAGASVYLTAVLEALTKEVLNLACVAAERDRADRINPRHLFIAMQSTEDLSRLTSNFCTAVQTTDAPILAPTEVCTVTSNALVPKSCVTSDGPHKDTCQRDEGHCFSAEALKADMQCFVDASIDKTATVYLRAVLKGLVQELLEIAGRGARDSGDTRITPHHIFSAVSTRQAWNTFVGYAPFTMGWNTKHDLLCDFFPAVSL